VLNYQWQAIPAVQETMTSGRVMTTLNYRSPPPRLRFMNISPMAMITRGIARYGVRVEWAANTTCMVGPGYNRPRFLPGPATSPP
jgi:hypothetical protein